jgi:hypothetical protein
VGLPVYNYSVKEKEVDNEERGEAGRECAYNTESVFLLIVQH